MKLEVSVPEIMEVINEVAKSQGGIFEMIRSDIREKVGSYLSKLMEVELTRYLGRQPYERGEERDVNHRNGTYPRRYGLKGIREIEVKVPRDREGRFHSRVIPKSKRYEEAIRERAEFPVLNGDQYLILIYVVEETHRDQGFSLGSQSGQSAVDRGGGAVADAGIRRRSDQVSLHRWGEFSHADHKEHREGSGACVYRG